MEHARITAQEHKDIHSYRFQYFLGKCGKFPQIFFSFVYFGLPAIPRPSSSPVIVPLGTVGEDTGSREQKYVRRGGDMLKCIKLVIPLF